MIHAPLYPRFAQVIYTTSSWAILKICVISGDMNHFLLRFSLEVSQFVQNKQFLHLSGL
jgi:hypothetical protein